MTTAAILALFAGVLAWPVPRLLARAHWPSRCPRSAIVLWQAIGLAGGVSALLAVIAFTFAPLSTDLPLGVLDHAGHVAAGDPLAGLGWINVIGLGVASALAARLFGVLALSTAQTLRHRRHHRHLVDLAGQDHGEHDATAASSAARPGDAGGGGCQPPDGLPACAGEIHRRGRLRVLDHPVAVAYCLPGVRHTRVVVSRGLLAALAQDELESVLEHEEAHARGRHDLVIQPFVAWQQTFPFLPPARDATAAVSLLVEMLADDTAARRTSCRTLARALARLGVARSPVPAGAVGITGISHGRAIRSSRASGYGRGLRARAGSARRWPGNGRGGQGGAADHLTSRPTSSSPIHAPVIARISRLLEPTRRAPLWAHIAIYLTAAAICAFPPAVLLAS
ncbi:M56 family metallopeptidase [Protofrankia sp. BMG5.30]|uniref:M56 family metallopeptidase n=1 Tax=Protofrankia sp. BMG5.30 TaxID=1834514 RepID=UPI00097585A8|nr:M56 family metallopeptidase [Protofrankia sp. BMG5.30]ONH34353.1 peptidase M48 [Protofrankia sp. BMG5.30]